MFTGIVAGVGRIVEVKRLSDDGGARLTIDASDVPAFAVRVGDSVAIAGACMTAIRVDATTFDVDTSKESLARTSGNSMHPAKSISNLRYGSETPWAGIWWRVTSTVSVLSSQ